MTPKVLICKLVILCNVFLVLSENVRAKSGSGVAERVALVFSSVCTCIVDRTVLRVFGCCTSFAVDHHVGAAHTDLQTARFCAQKALLCQHVDAAHNLCFSGNAF